MNLRNFLLDSARLVIILMEILILLTCLAFISISLTQVEVSRTNGVWPEGSYIYTPLNEKLVFESEKQFNLNLEIEVSEMCELNLTGKQIFEIGAEGVSIQNFVTAEKTQKGEYRWTLSEILKTPCEGTAYIVSNKKVRVLAPGDSEAIFYNLIDVNLIKLWPYVDWLKLILVILGVLVIELVASVVKDRLKKYKK